VTGLSEQPAELEQMKRMQYMSLLMLVAVSLTGCASMRSNRSGGLGEGLRRKCKAQQAWNVWSWCYEELDHPYHFARGFKAAYRDVHEGGNGCQPTLAPKYYWKSKFQSVEGRCKVNAWFDGYSHGALAAQQDGVSGLNQIPISPTARTNLQMASLQPQPFGASSYDSPMPIAVPAPPPAPGLPPIGGAANNEFRPDGEVENEGDVEDAGTQTDNNKALPPRPYE